MTEPTITDLVNLHLFWLSKKEAAACDMNKPRKEEAETKIIKLEKILLKKTDEIIKNNPL